MSLKLEAAQLLSRRIRTNASNGIRGSGLINAAFGMTQTRKIGNLFNLKSSSSGNILSFLWDAASKFIGWMGGLIKGIAFSASAVWSWLIGRIEQIKTFDWNASDEAYTKMMEAQNTRLASLWGGILGKGVGWFAGIAIGAGIGFLCPVIGGASLAKTVSLAVGTEALEEFIPALQSALVQTAGEFANRAILNGYMNYRNFLKRAPRDILVRLYGNDTADFIQRTWGGKGGPVISFNSKLDEFVDSIENDAIQAFVEEFLDESWDSFTEAGFVIAREIDDALQQFKVGDKAVSGTPRSVVLEPDKRAEESLTFVNVPQKVLMPTVQQTINAHRLIHNRDVGAIVGQPEESFGRATPLLRQLVIVFRDRPRPPWRHAEGKRCREVSYTIPDVKIGLTWREIKQAADSFMWGKWRATAHLNNRRQMAVYGASAEEAKAKLRELMRLSTAQIASLSVTEEEDRPQKLRKEAARMYPVYATLLARRNSVDGQGRTTLDDRILDEQVIRIPLWVDSAPNDLPPLQ